MSGPRPDLDVSVAGIARYVNQLGKSGFVHSVWLGGSRSPLSPKNSFAHSDWDLQLITGTKDRKKIPPPAESGVYADLFFFDQPSKYAVQLWPVDHYGILKC